MTGRNRHPHARMDKTVLTKTTLDESTENPPLGFDGVDPADRSRWIAEAAYYRAERRGFCPGCEMEDWLKAEQEIDEQLRADPAGARTVSAPDDVSHSAEPG